VQRERNGAPNPVTGSGDECDFEGCNAFAGLMRVRQLLLLNLPI
jgi:hypothetical protein